MGQAILACPVLSSNFSLLANFISERVSCQELLAKDSAKLANKMGDTLKPDLIDMMSLYWLEIKYSEEEA
jgi:hypothetical protein